MFPSEACLLVVYSLDSLDIAAGSIYIGGSAKCKYFCRIIGLMIILVNIIIFTVALKDSDRIGAAPLAPSVNMTTSRIKACNFHHSWQSLQSIVNFSRTVYILLVPL